MNCEIPTLHKENSNKQIQLPSPAKLCLDQSETSLIVIIENESNKYYKFDCLSPKKQDQWNRWKKSLAVNDGLMEEGLKLLGHWPNENELSALCQKIAEFRGKEIQRLSDEDCFYFDSSSG